ncbi:glycoside hydrolase family 26 protein [Dactylosporangium salmoneum]|uniref:GH26 domain-containing protein n=1 Tax=Dactylosporangium salmoneum TaxID=53361 RepID=A0ABN3H2P3_9ACTN
MDTKLVPTCGLLWGVAPGAFTTLTPGQALRNFEGTTGRPADILHSYHRGDEVFPTAEEISAVRQPRKRILFANWKVAWNTTWADVAEGNQDTRIDREAARLKAFPGTMFLALHHEPENDVRAGGGMTARDYAAMFRHTVQRLRADGVRNVVFVLVYMAYEPWCVKDWFADLYPGDDVVDWIGMDPYLFAKPGGYGFGDFSYLVDHTSDPDRWPGFYTWVTREHGNKPLMVAEWGVYEHTADPARKAWIYSTVAQQIGRFPAIRALVYFDSPNAPKGDTRPDSSQPALSEFRKLADSGLFSVTL